MDKVTLHNQAIEFVNYMHTKYFDILNQLPYLDTEGYTPIYLPSALLKISTIILCITISLYIVSYLTQNYWLKYLLIVICCLLFMYLLFFVVYGYPIYYRARTVLDIYNNIIPTAQPPISLYINHKISLITMIDFLIVGIPIFLFLPFIYFIQYTKIVSQTALIIAMVIFIILSQLLLTYPRSYIKYINFPLTEGYSILNSFKRSYRIHTYYGHNNIPSWPLKNWINKSEKQLLYNCYIYKQLSEYLTL